MMTQTYTESPAQAKRAEREMILDSLAEFAAQRPGLEFGNYGDIAAYRSEMRGITKDLHHARVLLAAVRWRSSIDADALKAALKGAFSGRLSWSEFPADKGKPAHWRLDYCTGQYWPTEYRKAVCAVLASALWDYTRDHAMPEGVLMHNSETGETLHRYGGLRAGDWLRRHFRKEFGRAIADRWFH